MSFNETLISNRIVCEMRMRINCLKHISGQNFEFCVQTKINLQITYPFVYFNVEPDGNSFNCRDKYYNVCYLSRMVMG